MAEEAGGNTSDTRLAQALQRSEARRAHLLVGVLLTLAVLLLTKELTDGIDTPWISGIGVRIGTLIFAIGYSLVLARTVRRANEQGRLMPASFWLGTTLLESSLPTIPLIELVRYSTLPHSTAIGAPAVLGYLIFATVSVLRLRPSLSVIGGVWSGVQHALLVSVLVADGNIPRPMISFCYGYSVLICVSGVCAGAVGREIRRHVLAGIRAAQTQIELSALRHDLQVAQSIQQQLLPREPVRLDGFEVAGWNRPAEETGGDYYDWMVLPDGRVAVAIADVTGHGIGPALLMAVCRAYARASVPATSELRAAVVRLNELVSHDLTDGRFVTFAVAVLDPLHNGLDLLSAGHGPTLIYRRSTGKVETLGGDSVPLGVIPDEQFAPPRRITLDAGDILMLVTDGFIEAQNVSMKLYGLDRLSEALKRHAADPIDTLLPTLDAAVREHMGAATQGDDMTAVVVRRR